MIEHNDILPDSFADRGARDRAAGPGLGGAPCADAAMRERLRQVEQEVADLEVRLSDAISLCVALEQLHGSTDHGEVLRAIQDVVINLVGSEELCVYEPAEDGSWLPVQSFGVGGARLAPVPAGHGPVGRVGAEGKAWLTGEGRPEGDPELTACVPLVAEGRAVAVLAIWRLLPQKRALCDADRRVLALVGPHAGRALLLTAQGAGRARAA